MSAGYEREFLKKIDPRVRIRIGFTTERGTVVRFVVQLEYRMADDWRVVARFDHDGDSASGHDVTAEGLHLDVCRDGEKYRVEREFPSTELNNCIRYCETYLEHNATRYVSRFERWHDVDYDTKP